MIRLLQWNIWNNEDIDNIIKELKRISPDIACIQELAKDIKVKGTKVVGTKYSDHLPILIML